MSLHHIVVTVNGEKREAEVDSRLLLVHFLRETLGLTGTHIGCDTSNCGACAVIMDGKAVKSCTILAVQADGKELLTVEGLAKNGKLHPVQEGFLKKHGLQCGFCTPGMLMTSYWLLQKNRIQRKRKFKGEFPETSADAQVTSKLSRQSNTRRRR